MQANDGPMATVFAAPGKYTQRRGATGRLGEVLELLGSDNPLVLSEPVVEEIMGDALEGLAGVTPGGAWGSSTSRSGSWTSTVVSPRRPATNVLATCSRSWTRPVPSTVR